MKVKKNLYLPGEMVREISGEMRRKVEKGAGEGRREGKEGRGRKEKVRERGRNEWRTRFGREKGEKTKFMVEKE